METWPGVTVNVSRQDELARIANMPRQNFSAISGTFSTAALLERLRSKNVRNPTTKNLRHPIEFSAIEHDRNNQRLTGLKDMKITKER